MKVTYDAKTDTLTVVLKEVSASPRATSTSRRDLDYDVPAITCRSNSDAHARLES